MPRTLIVDTDPGVDDVLAILLALASPEFNVKLISIVFGNTHAPMAHANLLKIYHVLEDELKARPEETKARYPSLTPEGVKAMGGKVKLAIGADGPIGGEKATAAYFHGKDGLSNLTETHPHFTPPPSTTPPSHPHLEMEERPSWEVMLDILDKEEEGSVTIVALGPLTNLAQALRTNPTTFARLGGIVWMGGALDVPGNTSPSAEFNCFADPYAAAEIVEAAKSGLVKLIMAPLDITSKHLIPFPDLIHPSVISAASASAAAEGLTVDFPVQSRPEAKVWNDNPTPLEGFSSAMLLRVRGLQRSFGLPDAMEMHDPVAIWYALSVASLPLIGADGSGSEAESVGWEIRQRDFKVERIGELTRGMCVVDRRGTGESSGEIRTKGERSTGEGSGEKKQATEKGRMGEDLVKSKNLPWVMVKSPGKEVLRKVLLERVFGGKI